MASDSLSRSIEGRIIVALYAAEACLVLGLVSWHRQIGRTNPAEFWVSLSGSVTLVAFIGMAAMLALAFSSCRADRQGGSRRWILALGMNVASVAVVLLLGEVGVRVLVVPANTGEKLGALLLYPRQWKKTRAAYLSILDKADHNKPYVVPDEDLGWTLGSGRSSQNGLYGIGSQGIRTPRAGEVISAEPRPCRIAIVGDSFTFGENVAFEDTWGNVLESALRGHCQVLNFGVPGFGVDQMYLRYLRDVRQWHPDIVILAFISDNVARTMGVYSFLTFPDAGVPFTKPRFVLQNGELRVVNQPLLTAREIFSASAIRDLPFIDFDRRYDPTEWDQPQWDLLSRSYLFRLLISVHPVHKLERPETSMVETVKINGALFRKFQEAVLADGARPLIVHLPTEGDILDEGTESLGVKVLKSARLPHIDLTPCMRSFSVPELFNPPEAGGHYSVKGNREAAQCLLTYQGAGLQGDVFQ